MGFGRPALQIVVDPLAVGERRMPRDGIWPIHGRVVEMLDQVIKPEVQQTFEIAAKQIGVFAEALTPAARDLHDLLRLRTVEEVDTDSTGRMVANLYTLVQRFDQTVKSFNEVLASPRNQENVVASLENIRASSEDVRAAMTDFKAFAADARTFAADARVATGNFNATLGSLRETVDSSGRKFADVADAASAVLRNVDRTVTLMNQGQGTMGLMLNDNRLYESLVLTTQRLTTAVEEIRDLVALMKKGNVRMSIF
jgi:methyl-accepting chemotaxis protein